jgi:hypothetical protein
MSPILETILETYYEETFMIADGFDDAIIGVDDSVPRLVYSSDKCIQILVDIEGMDYMDAIEHFEYNVRGSYMGEKTPLFINDNF